MKFLAIVLSVSLAGCAATPVSTYTNTKAVEQMENFIRAHAALQDTTPGPMKTECEMLEKLDPSEENEYACATFLSSQNIVLEADCSRDIGCEASGYKIRDPKTGVLTDGPK